MCGSSSIIWFGGREWNEMCDVWEKGTEFVVVLLLLLAANFAGRKGLSNYKSGLVLECSEAVFGIWQLRQEKKGLRIN